MSDPEKTVLPAPPPPGVVTPRQMEELEELTFLLMDDMERTDVRVRFKMTVYRNWCEKIRAIHEKVRALRGRS